MKQIELLKNFTFGRVPQGEKNREVAEIYNGARRRIMEIVLRRGETLARHKAGEPITVFCLAGSGTFRAGRNLEEERKLEAGTLVTLEAGIEHELVAEPEIHILVTRFKND
jgi:Uncharacterized conserved protein, contains double-stranded beta-helix domain